MYILIFLVNKLYLCNMNNKDLIDYDLYNNVKKDINAFCLVLQFYYYSNDNTDLYNKLFITNKIKIVELIV